MTDALGKLVRVGLRNPVRVVVKVQNKVRKPGELTEEGERRTPASYVVPLFYVCQTNGVRQSAEWIHALRGRRKVLDDDSHTERRVGKGRRSEKVYLLFRDVRNGRLLLQSQFFIFAP